MSVDLLANPRVKPERGSSLENRVSALENYIALLIGTDEVSSTLELAGTVKIGGRLCSTVASAINAVGELTANNFNTSSKQILGDFTFGASGAIKMITNINNGLWLSPGGILGKKAGSTTFSVDTSGNATFGGTLVAASGTFGAITAGSLTGVTITGGTLRTSETLQRVVIVDDAIKIYDENGDQTGQLEGADGDMFFSANNALFSGNLWCDGLRTTTASYLAANIEFATTQYIKWGITGQYNLRHDGSDFAFNDGITAAGSLKSTVGSIDQQSTVGRVRQYLCGLRSRAEPGSPDSGEVYIYYNSNNNALEVKFSDGAIFILADN